MKVTHDTMTVSQVLELSANNMLTVNSEYQRGAVWGTAQQKRLIDSVLRGYPLPLIYLHHLKREVAGHHRDDLEIVDGQQRINALKHFSQGAWKLFDPIKDDKEARFPEFIKRAECPWAGRDFQTLTDDDRRRFLESRLFVVKIETPSQDEARDLFIRLQAGLPLNAQEKRDAWPGGFTDFVLRIGGKPEILRYPGHEFFKTLMPAKSALKRGKNRHVAAQLAMLLVARHETGSFTDISTKAIDDFYYRHLNFDSTSPVGLRLSEILDFLVELLGDRKRRPLKGHEAIHLTLLVDTLMDDYAPAWRQRLGPAFDAFLMSSARDKATRRSPNPGEFWIQYDARTRTDSDRGETIRLRHEFFVGKMLEFMQPVTRKDRARIFSEEQRDLVYHEAGKRCAVCGQEIAWPDLEIHHVDQHVNGGATTLDNAVPVHKACHPRGEDAAREFAERWRSQRL